MLTYAPVIVAPLGRPHWNFVKISGINALESLGYHTVLFSWSYIEPFWYNNGLWQTDRPTRWQHTPC